MGCLARVISQGPIPRAKGSPGSLVIRHNGYCSRRTSRQKERVFRGPAGLSENTAVAMTALRQKLIDEIALRGFSNNTQEAYVRFVAGLARSWLQCRIEPDTPLRTT